MILWLSIYYSLVVLEVGFLCFGRLDVTLVEKGVFCLGIVLEEEDADD